MRPLGEEGVDVSVILRRIFTNLNVEYGLFFVFNVWGIWLAVLIAVINLRAP
jgi:hypothetical protein